MHKCLAIISLLTILASACAPDIKYTSGKNISDLQSRNIQDGENTLPSGRKIIVNGITKIDFPNGPSALVLNYTTTTPIDNKKDLRAEIGEIWLQFVKDVEGA